MSAKVEPVLVCDVSADPDKQWTEYEVLFEENPQYVSKEQAERVAAKLNQDLEESTRFQ